MAAYSSDLIWGGGKKKVMRKKQRNKETKKKQQTNKQQQIYTYRLHGVNQICPPVCLLLKFGRLVNKLLQNYNPRQVNLKKILMIMSKKTSLQTVL